MKITPLGVTARLLRGPVRAHLYHPDDPSHPPAAGLALLRRMALDQPVYSVRLQQGWPLDRIAAVPHDQLDLNTRLPGKTAYAAAFQAGGQVHLVVVAVSPVRELPPSPPRPSRRPHPAAPPAPPVRKRKRRKR